MKKTFILLTCEHAEAGFPSSVQIPKKLSQSHKAYDFGTKEITQKLESLISAHKKFSAKAFYYNHSRLLLDANRSEDTPHFQGTYYNQLNKIEKNKILTSFYAYKKNLEQTIKKNLSKYDRLVLLSIHSFTPVFNNRVRKTDLGLLHRVQIQKERNLALSLQKNLKTNLKKNLSLSIHLNLPYRGHTDCMLNNLLDQHLKNKNVTGLCIEFNQKNLKKNTSDLASCFTQSLIQTLS